jgi:hypothetical protein
MTVLDVRMVGNRSDRALRSWSHTVLTPEPIDVGVPPTDVVVARPVTPGEASGLRVESFDATTGRLTLLYEPACEAADHVVVFGPLEAVGSYGYTGVDCAIGNLGLYDAFEPGPGSVFFLVAGSDGESIEGPCGTSSAALERPEAADIGECALAQDLALRCDE